MCVGREFGLGRAGGRQFVEGACLLQALRVIVTHVSAESKTITTICINCQGTGGCLPVYCRLHSWTLAG